MAASPSSQPPPSESIKYIWVSEAEYEELKKKNASNEIPVSSVRERLEERRSKRIIFEPATPKVAPQGTFANLGLQFDLSRFLELTGEGYSKYADALRELQLDSIVALDRCSSVEIFNYAIKSENSGFGRVMHERCYNLIKLVNQAKTSLTADGPQKRDHPDVWTFIFDSRFSDDIYLKE